MDLDYTQKLLCANDESKKITIYGFLQVVRKHGFPFESMMSANAESAIKPTSEEARAEIAKMVIPLVTEFSDAEVQGHLVTIYGWYKGIKRDDDQGHQARGEEWARLIKEARQVSTKTEAHLQAEKVDAARRAISFFYQRFMMVWRIGPISRDMFATASFPGKPRIKDFLRYVQPLDRANLTVVIGKQDIDWSVKKPEIYHFLEKLI
ncbi:hypothetical protein BDA99DRAFT_521219 [Phascolomyces articulosus]|uniref:Uncharacterized protein n=1 Tax=Phascolomyces articulosus TaxID=60185 RepID=A0AAD5P9T9_9FUNG|nr:hypothetical protein BDA99DRAFT_521219 [Phascolomyces articulosus]